MHTFHIHESRCRIVFASYLFPFFLPEPRESNFPPILSLSISLFGCLTISIKNIMYHKTKRGNMTYINMNTYITGIYQLSYAFGVFFFFRLLLCRIIDDVGFNVGHKYHGGISRIHLTVIIIIIIIY